jgi:hypothetical protein
MSNQTFREVPAAIVLQACDRYIEARNRRIEAKRERLIAAAMKPKFWGLCSPLTREAAINSLEDGGWDSPWNMINHTGGYRVNRVKEIRSLCMLPGKPYIKLSSEDAAILVDYIE